MKNPLTILLLLLLFAVKATAQNYLFFSAPIVITVVNTGTNTYVGNDVSCPSVYLNSYQNYATYVQNNSQDFQFSVPPNGGSVQLTAGGPSGLGPEAIVYGASGARSQWSVVMNGQTLFSQWYYFSTTSPSPPSVPTIYVDGDTCAFTTTAPIQYTNYTVCLNNTLSTPATATWTYNGSVVKSEVLQPGQSDCWTTPQIEVSPNPQNFTLNAAYQPMATTITTGTNGDLGFSNPTYTNTTSGSGGVYTNTDAPGGTFTSGTNGITFTTPATGDPAIPNTNAIVWSSSGGGTAAQDSTLKQGFDVVHKDLNNLLSGENILNSTLNTYLTTITNQLGQIVTYQWQGSNNDTMQLVSAITNLGKNFPTNPVTVNLPTNLSLTMSNYATESTLAGISNLLAHWTNNPATNSPGGMTNYATESTLEALTNGLFGGVANTNFGAGQFAPTNDFGGSVFSDTTNWQFSYDGATNGGQLDTMTGGTTQPVETGIMNWIAGFADPSAGMPDYYPAVDMTYSFDLGGAGSYSIDFDPLHNDGLAAIFAFARQMFAWVLAFIFLEKIAKDAVKVVFILQGAHGANPTAVRATVNSMS